MPRVRRAGHALSAPPVTPEIRAEMEACVRQERRRQWGRIAAIIAIVLAIWVTSFQGRADLVQSQREGCSRGKLDRAANAEGWRIAEAARRAEGQTDVAARYARIAASLEARAKINCAERFPDPGPFAFGGAR